MGPRILRSRPRTHARIMRTQKSSPRGSLARVSPYYATTADPAPARVALEDSIECDVCVVGGGIAGCSTALHLAERGYRVALLERHRVGWGASGRNGGQALPGTGVAQQELERLIGPADARAVWDVTVAGLELARRLIEKYPDMALILTSSGAEDLSGLTGPSIALLQFLQLLLLRSVFSGIHLPAAARSQSTT